MKQIIFMLALTLGGFAQAKTEIITTEKFLKNVKDYIMHLGNHTEAEFIGELADIGGECRVSLVKDEKGRYQIVLKSDKNFQLVTSVRLSEKVKVQSIENEDGSFEHTYSYGYGGVNKFTITSHDDAGMSIALKSGVTSLLCEVNF